MRYYAYSPLARGVLTGKFGGSADDANPMQQRYLSSSMSEALAGLDAACELHNLELRAAALRWLVYHSSLDPTCGDGVILGASSLAQIKDNALAASAGPLPREVVDAFDDANAVLHPVATYPFHQAMPL